MHQSVQSLPDGDILIHVGDLTQSGTPEELNDALKWLNSHPHTYKIFIAGNHDKTLADPSIVEKIRETYPSLIYLHDSEATVSIRTRTMNIYGSPYTPRYGSGSFQYPRVHPSQATSSSLWSKIPLQTDILITHGPPSYYLDIKGSGCPALLQALWRIRPQLHVFGHIHAARGVEDVFWTPYQKIYEKSCEEGGGFMNLVSLLVHIIHYFLKGGHSDHRETVLVNASIVGGYRDELRRGAIVVDI